jgi:hypothetical protein
MTPELAAALVLLAADSAFLGGVIVLLFAARCIRDIGQEQAKNDERGREHDRWLRLCEERDEPWRSSTGG